MPIDLGAISLPSRARTSLYTNIEITRVERRGEDWRLPIVVVKEQNDCSSIIDAQLIWRRLREELPDLAPRAPLLCKGFRVRRQKQIRVARRLHERCKG